MDGRLWANTYAATNEQEYWAEGVQSYFDTNIEAIPSNGIHNHVNTRAELRNIRPPPARSGGQRVRWHVSPANCP